MASAVGLALGPAVRLWLRKKLGLWPRLVLPSESGAQYHLWAIPTRTSIISLHLYIELKQFTSLRDPEEEEEEGKEEKSKSPAGSTCVKQHVAGTEESSDHSWLLLP